VLCDIISRSEPDRSLLGCWDRSDTLLDRCPYMPKSFQDWVEVTRQMGPALPQVTKAAV